MKIHRPGLPTIDDGDDGPAAPPRTPSMQPQRPAEVIPPVAPKSMKGGEDPPPAPKPSLTAEQEAIAKANRAKVAEAHAKRLAAEQAIRDAEREEENALANVTDDELLDRKPDPEESAKAPADPPPSPPTTVASAPMGAKSEAAPTDGPASNDEPGKPQAIGAPHE